MARRQAGFSELLDFASKLPWKVGCALAAASFLVLHFTAAAFLDAPKVTKPADLGAAVIHQDIHTFAYLLQIVIPAGLLIGATVSFLGGARRRALFAKAGAAPSETISGLEWQDFEKLVGEHFRRNGYNVVERGGPKPYGGVDLIVTTTRQRYLVQCKHWRSRQVGVGVVRELNGVVAAEGAEGGFVVTAGEFTREAREFARKTKIKLIHGEELEALIGSDAARRSYEKLESADAPDCRAVEPPCFGALPSRGGTLVIRSGVAGNTLSVRGLCRFREDCGESISV